MVVDAYLGWIVGQAGHFEGVLDDGCVFVVAADAVGIQLQSWSLGYFCVFGGFKGVESCALAVDLILNDNVVDD